MLSRTTPQELDKKQNKSQFKGRVFYLIFSFSGKLGCEIIKKKKRKISYCFVILAKYSSPAFRNPSGVMSILCVAIDHE